LTAVAILGLGIGANASIFSVVNAVVLRPLPFPDSSRLVDVWHTPPREQFAGRPTFSVSPANYLDWRAQSTAFEHMAIYGFRPANLTGLGEPDPLQGVVVSGEYFQVLRGTAVVGRLLDEGDEDPGRSHVVVLGEHVWNSRFGADPTVVGRSIRLNGELYTVVGVMPQRLRFPAWADVWLPLVWTPEERAVRGEPQLPGGRARPRGPSRCLTWIRPFADGCSPITMKGRQSVLAASLRAELFPHHLVRPIGQDADGRPSESAQSRDRRSM
jgi:hypothetical protein